MTSLESPRDTLGSPRPFTGRHLLYWLAGFFGVMLIANVIFIWLALDTFSGVTSKTAYQDGIAYNQRLEAAAAQQALGWEGEVTQEPQTVVLSLSDAEGKPVRGLALDARFLRPTNDDQDQTRPMVEAEPGRYVAPLGLPAGGNWNLVISGTAADGTPFETRTRLWVD